jgi:hypothetical protein
MGEAGALPHESPSILHVVLDCARAKSLKVGGAAEPARTPTIDGLAARGTTFTRAVAPANWTIPSHMSFFTGVYPFEHRVRTFRHGDPPMETIAQYLKQQGYETALFSEMVHLVSGYGLEAGFDRKYSPATATTDEERTMATSVASRLGFLYGPKMRRLIGQLPPFVVPLNAFNYPQEVAYKASVCGDYLLDAFRAFLASRDRARPFYAFFNFVDAHEPYPENDPAHNHLGALARWYSRTPRYYLLSVEPLQRVVPWTALEAGYRKSIENADRKIGALLTQLGEGGLLDRTLVVVTSDHGQSFGEGGNVYHGCGSTDSVTRVPLVVAGPQSHELPSRVDRWMSIIETPAWFKAVANGRYPFTEDGRPTVVFGPPQLDGETVYCEGGPASDPNHSLEGIGADRPWNRRQIAAYRDERKFVLDLATQKVAVWEPAADFDRASPRTLSDADAKLIRQNIFRRFETAQAQGAAPASTARSDTLPADLDKRLRSWGYD